MVYAEFHAMKRQDFAKIRELAKTVGAGLAKNVMKRERK